MLPVVGLFVQTKLLGWLVQPIAKEILWLRRTSALIRVACARRRKSIAVRSAKGQAETADIECGCGHSACTEESRISRPMRQAVANRRRDRGLTSSSHCRTRVIDRDLFPADLPRRTIEPTNITDLVLSFLSLVVGTKSAQHALKAHKWCGMRTVGAVCAPVVRVVFHTFKYRL